MSYFCFLKNITSALFMIKVNLYSAHNLQNFFITILYIYIYIYYLIVKFKFSEQSFIFFIYETTK